MNPNGFNPVDTIVLQLLLHVQNEHLYVVYLSFGHNLTGTRR